MIALTFFSVRLRKCCIVIEYNFGWLRKNGKLKHSWSFWQTERRTYKQTNYHNQDKQIIIIPWVPKSESMKFCSWSPLSGSKEIKKSWLYNDQFSDYLLGRDSLLGVNLAESRIHGAQITLPPFIYLFRLG